MATQIEQAKKAVEKLKSRRSRLVDQITEIDEALRELGIEPGTAPSSLSTVEALRALSSKNAPKPDETTVEDALAAARAAGGNQFGTTIRPEVSDDEFQDRVRKILDDGQDGDIENISPQDTMGAGRWQ